MELKYIQKYSILPLILSMNSTNKEMESGVRKKVKFLKISKWGVLIRLGAGEKLKN